MGNKSSGDERGASLVELAFALPLLIMLLVGMVSAGVAYNHQLSLTHAAREAGRYAATLPVDGDSDAWLETVIGRTIADATGTLDVGVPDRYICVAYVDPNSTDETRKRVLNDSGLQDSEPGTCFDDFTSEQVSKDGRRVQIGVARSSNFSVVFWSSELTLSSAAVNRFEAALGSG